jgi:hypothetical protein
MKYYKVLCERAHVGKGRTAYITFYYEAENALHAMNKAKCQRGTKRSKLPLGCSEVSKEEYLANISTSAYVRAGVRD